MLQITDSEFAVKARIVFLRDLVFPRCLLVVIFAQEPAMSQHRGLAVKRNLTHLWDALRMSNSVTGCWGGDVLDELPYLYNAIDNYEMGVQKQSENIHDMIAEFEPGLS